MGLGLRGLRVEMGLGLRVEMGLGFRGLTWVYGVSSSALATVTPKIT